MGVVGEKGVSGSRQWDWKSGSGEQTSPDKREKTLIQTGKRGEREGKGEEQEGGKGEKQEGKKGEKQEEKKAEKQKGGEKGEKGG